MTDLPGRRENVLLGACCAVVRGTTNRRTRARPNATGTTRRTATTTTGFVSPVRFASPEPSHSRMRRVCMEASTGRHEKCLTPPLSCRRNPEQGRVGFEQENGARFTPKRVGVRRGNSRERAIDSEGRGSIRIRRRKAGGAPWTATKGGANSHFNSRRAACQSQAESLVDGRRQRLLPGKTAGARSVGPKA